MAEGIGDKIAGLMDSSIASDLFPGAVWLVEEKGIRIAEGSAGYAERIPTQREMSRTTIFDLASLTKPICTGTIALRMWDKGQISPDHPVSRYLPEFSGDWRNHVTLGQVLSHSSGLPSGIPLSKICSDPSEVLKRICEVEMAYPPGEKTLYSDVGFILLGKLMERLSGMPLDELTAKEVFTPLGMEHTMYRPDPGLRCRIAATQDCPARKRVLIGEVHDGNAFFMGGISGHAGLFSCIDDLAGFCRMMLGRGPSLLSGQTIEEATRVWADDGENAYGISWFKRKFPVSPASSFFSERAYGHTGYTGTSIWIEPARELFAILLTNRIHPDRNADRIPEMNLARRKFHDIALGH